MDILRLYNNKIWVSSSEDPDKLIVKIAICDFSTNKNGVRLDRATIESWMSTLVTQPVVGKVVLRANGVKDFTGHNAHVVKSVDENGNECYELTFDTSALGTFTSVGIEELDGVEQIVAEAVVWKRFKDASEIIERRCANGTLATSWEISVGDSELCVEDGKIVKVIKAGRFIGHCLLGENVAPAYDSSRVLDVAESDNDVILINALISNESSKEESMIIDTANQIVESEEQAEVNATQESQLDTTTDVSALTQRDLRNAICKAIADVHGGIDHVWVDASMWFPEDKVMWVKIYSEEDLCPNELDYVSVTYSVEADVVTIVSEEPVTLTVSPRQINSAVEDYQNSIAELNNTVAELNNAMQQLRETIAELQPYREEHERAEAERKQAEHDANVEELRRFVIDSAQFTESEYNGNEIASLIEALDRESINKMISERLVKSVRDKTNKQVQQANTQININLAPEVDKVKAVRQFLFK